MPHHIVRPRLMTSTQRTRRLQTMQMLLAHMFHDALHLQLLPAPNPFLVDPLASRSLASAGSVECMAFDEVLVDGGFVGSIGKGGVAALETADEDALVEWRENGRDGRDGGG
ncbi:hypothetical protein AX17_001578 [Amanita inopinata Kibby_2008]|nr:hypothetical protein AX17_001578 [Amanita inopinata Kibby_2008]